MHPPTVALLGRSSANLKASPRTLLAATLLVVTAAPGAAQTEPKQIPHGNESLSAAAVEAASRYAGDAPLPEEAQQTPSLLGDIARDYGRFFTTRKTYVTLGVGLAASLAVMPFDEDIRDSSFNSELPKNAESNLGNVLDPGRHIGGRLFRYGSAVAAYGIGSLLGKPGVAELGRDLLRVQILTSGVTQLVKQTVRRTRPDGSNELSYPSGHTSGTFASATVLQRHFGWKVGVPAFSVASYVGASRLAHNRHYLSDVVFGAAIGIAAGRTITYSKGATLFELAPTAAPGGATVQVSVTKLP